MSKGRPPQCPICGAYHQSYLELIIDHQREHHIINQDGHILFFNGKGYVETGGQFDLRDAIFKPKESA